jgi:hypothetical protein
MQAGEPDRDVVSAPGGTLAARLRALLRTRDARTARWEVAAAVAVFIALGPLVTIAGARLLTRHENTQIAQLQSDLAPRLAAEQAARTARNEIGAAIRRPAVGATLEALSRALPADASLARAERTAQGALEFDVTTTDPDRLRAAIRRVPELAGLRDSGQRQGDGAMLVSLHQDAQ